MRSYNEDKLERAIRRKAIGITISILFLFGTATAILVSENPKELMPEFMQEWLKEEAPSATKDERV